MPALRVLPRVLTSLHGRRGTVRQLREACERGDTLLTVGGPPGVGKSRLVAEALLGLSWPVSWFDLHGEDDPAATLATLEAWLAGLPPSEGARLVVLDGVDRLTEQIWGWLDGARERSPTVRWVVTARHPVAPRATTAIRLSGLDVETASALFLDRARARQPDLRQSAIGQDTIVQICRTLEGMPLSLEHAASYVPLLGLRGVQAELEGAIFDGTGEAPSGPAHHQSLRRAVAWTWDTLSEDVRRAAIRWSLFGAAFDHASGGAVGQLSPTAARDAARRLAEVGLAIDGAEGRTRLTFLARVYASAMLVADASVRSAQSTHAAWHLSRAKELGALHRTGWHAEAAAETRRISRDLQTALVFQAPFFPSEVAAALDDLVPFRIGKQGGALVVAVTEAMPLDALPAGLRCRMWCLRAEGHARAGRGAAVEDALQRARRWADAAEERHLVVSVDWREGRALHMLERTREAGGFLDRAAKQVPPGHRLSVRIALDRGIVAAASGDPVTAAQHFVQARANAPRPDPLTAAAACYQEGLLALDAGELASGDALLRRAVTAFSQMKIETWAGLAEAGLAAVAVQSEEWDLAWPAFDRALARLEHEGAPAIRSKVHTAHGLARLLAGEPVAAERAGALALVEANRAGAPLSERRARLLLAACALRSGIERTARYELEACQTIRGTASAVEAAAMAVVEAWLAGGPLPAPRPPPMPPTLRWLEKLAARGLSVEGAIGLLLGPSARWFQLGDAQRVDMKRRGAARRILLALAEAREAGLVGFTSRDELVAAGWPGESLPRQTASNRLHVTLSSLRKLGLEAVLVRSDRGYRLDPAVVLHMEPSSTAAGTDP